MLGLAGLLASARQLNAVSGQGDGVAITAPPAGVSAEAAGEREPFAVALLSDESLVAGPLELIVIQRRKLALDEVW